MSALRTAAPVPLPREFYALLHRFMRLAYEEGEAWLVEPLEKEREQIAAQAAYALALESEAGPR